MLALICVLAGLPGACASSASSKSADSPATDQVAAAIDAAWDFSDPGASESRFQTLADDVQPSDNPLARTEYLTQVARAQGLQGKFEKARATLEGIKATTGPTRTKATVRWLLESGRVRNSSEQAGRGRAEFVEAWNIARELREDALAVDAAHMVAIAAGDDAKQAIEWNERAIKYAEGSSDERARRWQGSLYNNLGWAYHDLGRYPAALDAFRRALREREKTPEKRAALLTARWAVGRALRSLAKFDEALAIQEGVAAEYASDGREDGFVEEELGECLLALGRPIDAATHFGKAYDLLSHDALLVAHEPGRIERLREHGASR
jgi:tetratricopeptide (TPR) repeat protein